MSDLNITAQKRVESGKAASRRLRRLEGRTPVIVYGNGEASSLTVFHKDIYKLSQSESFYSQIITIDIEGKKETVVLKDLQRHPAKAIIVHADFQRVNKNTVVHIRVPLHYINEDKCVGVKAGGKIAHSVTEIDISCAASNLPEFLEIDMQNVELDQIVHLSDIALPTGVSIVELTHGEDHDAPIASIHTPKGEKASEEDSTEEA